MIANLTKAIASGFAVVLVFGALSIVGYLVARAMRSGKS